MARCPKCALEVLSESQNCPSCGSVIDSLFTTPSSWEVESSGHQAPLKTRGLTLFDQLIPGRLLAARYRVVERLGRGGMGDVYRAEDLKLGQTVALKFLPAALSQEPARREVLFREVRIARQVSHPNVCRVHDIEEMDGMHFLSMEFVDGENLASLLTRIGRLPLTKANDVAREMCAGLAAIHDRGVIHRDLKPGNVMIDGSGHVRITDFGLAERQGVGTDPDLIVGTPAYMAPECLLEGRAPTVQSDLYSLGLVLYELFTGRRAFEAVTLKEMIRLRREADLAPPSKHQRDLDLLIESMILRCLEVEPERRPASARTVAAVLPGGDPLAAAIAAGETPSPELVAASASGDQGLKPVAAWTGLIGLIAGLLAVTAVASRTRMVPALTLTEPPQAMASRARALLSDLGFDETPADRAFGYRYHESAVEHIVLNDRSPSRWDELSRAQAQPVTFWYRESLSELVPTDRWHRVTYQDPPPTSTGMVGVELDGWGRLRRLDAPPPHALASEGPAIFDWNPFFWAAGLDTANFAPVTPSSEPIEAGNERITLEGHDRDNPDQRVRVEVVGYRGRPVYFAVLDPWMRTAAMASAPSDPSGRMTALVSGLIRPILILIAMLIGAWLARRNLRAGRGDVKRALRVAGGMMAIRVGIWLLGGHHMPRSATEQFMSALAWGLYDAAYGWIFYVAIEPYVRRLWPRVMTSWVRLLDGRLADPRVGRDLLMGCLLGTLIALAVAAHQAAPMLFGAPPGRPDNVGYVEHQLAALLGPQQQGAELLWLWRSNLVLIMGFVVILVVSRILLRTAGPAVALAFLLFVPIALPKGEILALNVGLAVFSTVALLVVMFRFGLLAAGVGLLIHTTLQSAGLGLGSWSTGSSLLVLLLVFSLGVYGFARALGGRQANGALVAAAP